MIRRLKRTSDFELALQINNEHFINPPRLEQKNWLLNKVMQEFAHDLNALNDQASEFVAGQSLGLINDRSQITLSDAEIMEDWQNPIMQAMADIVTATVGDVLEIGFGRGVSASYIQQAGVNSHTIIEVNDSCVQRFHQWQQQYPQRNISLIHSLWEEADEQLSLYDGIFFHTFPLTDQELLSATQLHTFAQPFFACAAQHLRSGGVFTYLSNEIDSLSRGHQRLLFQYFQSFTLSIVKPLKLPDDIKDSWWSDSMVIIKAVK